MGLEVLAIGLTAASGAMSAAGSISEGNGAAAAANYRAAVARNNASLATANANATDLDVVQATEDAKRAGVAGQRTVAEQDQRARGEIALVESQFAASGVSGAGDKRVLNSLRTLAAQDRFNLREGVDSQTAQARDRVVQLEQEAINYRNQAIGFESDAQFETAMGKNAKTAGVVGAVGAVASAAGSIGGTYLGMPSSRPTALQSALTRKGRFAPPPLRRGPG